MQWFLTSESSSSARGFSIGSISDRQSWLLHTSRLKRAARFGFLVSRKKSRRRFRAGRDGGGENTETWRNEAVARGCYPFTLLPPWREMLARPSLPSLCSGANILLRMHERYPLSEKSIGFIASSRSCRWISCKWTYYPTTPLPLYFPPHVLPPNNSTSWRGFPPVHPGVLSLICSVLLTLFVHWPPGHRPRAEGKSCGVEARWLDSACTAIYITGKLVFILFTPLTLSLILSARPSESARGRPFL